MCSCNELISNEHYTRKASITTLQNNKLFETVNPRRLQQRSCRAVKSELLENLAV